MTYVNQHSFTLTALLVQAVFAIILLRDGIRVMDIVALAVMAIAFVLSCGQDSACIRGANPARASIGVLTSVYCNPACRGQVRNRTERQTADHPSQRSRTSRAKTG